MIDIDDIKSKHPSLCFSCEHARRVAHDDNLNKGWVGCAEYVRRSNDDSFLHIAKEIGEGWVDLRSSPFGNRSGAITNLVLVTRGVDKCSSFHP